MNWYKTSQQIDVPDRLNKIRSEIDVLYSSIQHDLDVDKHIQADPYDNVARLITLNKVDKIIGKYFGDLGWKAK
jgi:hypothetical protein